MDDDGRGARYPARWGTAALVAAAGLGLFIRIVAGDGPLTVDEWWREVVAELPEPLRGASLVLDAIGGGILAHFWIPVGLIVVLLLLRRQRDALVYAAATLASTGLVQAGKAVFARARPDDIVIDVASFAYPSGHAAIAATIATALWVAFPRGETAVLGAAATLAMAFSRTHLSAHWLTDTIGGMLVGVGAVLVVSAIVDRLERATRLVPGG